ncbi:hypothetical protein [Methylobacterium gossipiicola]|uniref:WGR domain-containing protein n=1 Tax=Methylobacterium gossipiicola TaxID=582675 RepID=A0A1I2X2M6_9HYPH|nr:hypothetical protein [Methylobacterium gossipiicola]SFH07785.1 hypothetical protein SAMN05192565_13128 [Methylobacterium gossipiicola]
MKCVRSEHLHLRQGTSDKVYEVDLVENETLSEPERYLVNVRYGRRGAILREGTKTPQPVAEAAAMRVFDSVVVSKCNAGYRRTQGGFPAETDGTGVDDRNAVLLARLATCRRERWSGATRDRLLWRIGQLRIAQAASDLVALAGDIEPERASYSLVWALARAGGAAAVPTLEGIAAGSGSAVIRDLARFALAAAPTDAESRNAELPPAVAGAVEAGDVAGLCAALAGQDASQVGPILMALGRRARREPRCHATLCAALARLPARPPYLLGLRRLFKHAEMADDAGLFGATAHRFETATAMYRSGRDPAYVPELGRYIATKTSRGVPDRRIGLSSATHLYLKRRVWRALRKRGEVDDPAFAEMAAAFLLCFSPEDLDRRTAWSVWTRGPDGTWSREPRAQGPFGRRWSVSQLLFRHAAGAMPRPRSLTVLERAEPDPDSRDEAFPHLWSARPDLALRLAAEARVEAVAHLGLRVLRADPAARATLSTADLGRLLIASVPAAQQFGFETVRDRLAVGAVDPALLTILVAAALPEARGLALRRIEADPALPWSETALAFAMLTSPEPDVAAAVAQLAGTRAPSPEAANALGRRLVEWLRAMPPSPDEEAVAAIRAMRAGLAVLWPKAGLPVSGEAVIDLMTHPATEVAAAGIDLLSRSEIDVAHLPAELWERLIGAEAENVRAAALGLMARLDAAGLERHAAPILALAHGADPALRRAARPLVRRLAETDPALAARLVRDVIDSLFRTAPDETYPADMVALLTEAVPGELAALDAGTVWRLLQARAKGAQRLGASVLAERSPQEFSVRQIARLGGHPHRAVRLWAMAAFEAEPARFQAQAADAVLLVESEWPDALAFARTQFEAWPEEVWTPDVLAVVTDSVKPEVLAFARHLLRSRLRPEDTEAQLLRLLEHPSPAMHLLITELLTERSLADEDAFDRLIPLARIVMLQVLKGRVAKDRMTAFLRTQALGDRARAQTLLALFADLSLSGTARDRAAAILTLRDIADAHPDLDTPLVRRPSEARAFSAGPGATR